MCSSAQNEIPQPGQGIAIINKQKQQNNKANARGSVISRYIVIYRFNVAQYIFYDIAYRYYS